MLIGVVLFLLILLLFFRLIFLPVINLHWKTIKLTQQPQAQSQTQHPSVNKQLWKTALMRSLSQRMANGEHISEEELAAYHYFESLEYEHQDSNIDNATEKTAARVLRDFMVRCSAKILKDKEEK